MWELEQTLQKKLDDLIKIGLSVNTINSNLCRLEKEGKKDSPEFQKFVSYLQIATEVENEKIKDITYDEDDMNELFYFLEKKYNLYAHDPYYDYMYFDAETRVATRIMKTLETALDEVYIDNTFEDDYDDDFLEDKLFKVYSDFNKMNIYQNLKNKAVEIESTKELSDISISNNNKSVKDLYLEYKYNAAFVDKDIEWSFIFNNFDASELLLLKPREQARNLGMSIAEYINEKHYYLSYDIFIKSLLYAGFSEVDLLLPVNAEKRVLILWHLCNIFNNLNYYQLLEIGQALSQLPQFNNLDVESQKNILGLIENSIENAINNSKGEFNNKPKNYKKKK